MKFSKFLTEAGVAFNNILYPKFNNIVILAGGSASGKGFVLNNVLLISGKVYDIDDLKDLIIKDQDFNDAFFDYLENHYVSKGKKLDSRVSEILEKGLTPDELDLKNPLDTSILHFFTAYKDYDNKLKNNLFLQAAKTDRKPNVIFDVTMKNTDILDMIWKYVVLGGYDPLNVHLVWVINSVKKAIEQNSERSRVVSLGVLKDTHKGVSETMKQILKNFDTKLSSGEKVSDLIQGDVWIVPNLEGVDADIRKSGQGNFEITMLNKFQVKESGKPVIPFADLERKYFTKGSNLLAKINSYVPDDAKWDSE